ncbi:hypothetical protein WKV44_02650 [Spirochaetia bacterium 38H-sp]|uniref:Uncharacterized protein n=1 Tax=Rarispira pelagica TaxID=3141764 RepID=A0ABU9U9T7_9SPIR
MSKKLVFLRDIVSDTPIARLFCNVPVSDVLLKKGFAPPLVCHGDELVWGYGLFSALVNAGAEKHEAIDIDGDTADLLVFALSCEGRAGRYSWEERERLFFFCRDAGILEYVDRIIPLVEPGKKDFSHIGVFSQLMPSLKAMVADNLVDIKTASYVSSLPDSVLGLIRFYDGRLSFSERRQILIWFKDCFVREGWDEESAIEKMTEILASSTPFEAVKRMRFPMLSDMQRDFARLRKNLTAKSGVALEAPDFFEGAAFSVSFKFESKSQLERRIEVLKKIAENADELFSFLG